MWALYWVNSGKKDYDRFNLYHIKYLLNICSEKIYITYKRKNMHIRENSRFCC